MDFGKNLRHKLDEDNRIKLSVALAGVANWLTEEVVPNIEKNIEESVSRGTDRTSFMHSYVNGYRPDVEAIEDIPAYRMFQSTCEKLGLEYLPLSHKLFGERDPAHYPCLEIIIRLPAVEGGKSPW